jgi:hypothetical protein
MFHAIGKETEDDASQAKFANDGDRASVRNRGAEHATLFMNRVRGQWKLTQNPNFELDTPAEKERLIRRSIKRNDDLAAAVTRLGGKADGNEYQEAEDIIIDLLKLVEPPLTGK